MKKTLFLLLPLLLIFSCTVQKRKYQNGYYVNWHAKNASLAKDRVVVKPSNVSDKKSTELETTPIRQNPSEELFASTKTDLLIPSHKKPVNFFNQLSEDTCDVLLFKDGSEIRGKVLEVSGDEIKYKRCDTPDGPTYVSRKSELFMIKYANGTREVIRSDEPPKQTKKPTYDTRSKKYENASQTKQVDELAVVSFVAGILAIVIGIAALNFLAAITGPAVGILLLLPFFLALIAAITGRISFKRIKENSEFYKGKGFSMTGFIMGLSVLGIYALVIFFLLLLLLILI
jgi:hypothetical protein